MAQSELKYEESLKRLEKLVTDLDKPELELETRLKKFEEGTKLARVLLTKLEQSKKKVEKLVKTQGGESLVAADDDDETETKDDDLDTL